MAQTFGYVKTDFPNLTDLLLRVFVTDFSNNLKAEQPTSLSHFVIQSSTQVMNSSVFLSQWCSNIAHFKSYNLISGFISQKLKIDELLLSLEIEPLLEVMTFEAVERRIVSSFRDQIGKDSGKEYQELKEAIKKIVLVGYIGNSPLFKHAASFYF